MISTPTRTCAYCRRPISGVARQLPDSSALVDLGHSDCYERYLNVLFARPGACSADSS